MKYSKFILLCLFVSLFGTKSYAELKPSIYMGTGVYTNLGGIFGIGAELKYKSISFNCALGLECLFLRNPLYNIDIGVKLYLRENVFGGSVFGGVNFGYSSKPELFWTPINNFTFSIGYRHTIYKHLYGMGYLGLTSDNLAFMPEKDRKYDLIPTVGIIIGYEF